jgi:hypothetical protein
MKIDLQNRAETARTLIEATSRIYAAAISQGDISAADMMRRKARDDVRDYLALLDEVSK